MESFYDISVRDSKGREINFSDYKGKYILIVNVASECGYTPQYAQLQELYKQYNKSLEIIACPCNDFGGQEPGSNEQIQEFCELNYGITFTITEKLNIKTDPHPLYRFLTTEELNGKENNMVKWNFHKFLIDKNGKCKASFPSSFLPTDSDLTDWLGS